MLKQKQERRNLKKRSEAMPLITVYIERQVYEKLRKLYETGLFQTEASVIQTAILLLAKVFEECDRRGLSKEDCLERCIDLIFAR